MNEKQKRDALYAVSVLLRTKEHQDNIIMAVRDVRDSLDKDSPCREIVTKAVHEAIGHSTSVDATGVAMKALKAIAPELYDEKKPAKEMLDAMEKFVYKK